MINRKLVLIAILLISLFAISAVSANDYADDDATKLDMIDSSLELSQDYDSAIESDLSSDYELSDEKNVLKSSDDGSIVDDSKSTDVDDALSKSPSDLNDTVYKSADEHILSMDENSWFYDKIVWYEGDYDDGEYVNIDFVDIENPDNITIKLSVYESPIPNVDLAVLNDYDYTITKLTTGSDGIVTYNIPFSVNELSIAVGFWHDENYLSNYGRYEDGTLLFSFNFDTWYRDPSQRYYDFVVTVTDREDYEDLIGAQVILTSDSNQYVATVKDDGNATLSKVAYGTYEVKVLYDGYRIFSLFDDDAIEYYNDHSSGSLYYGDDPIYEMEKDDFDEIVYLDLYFDWSEMEEDDSVYEDNLTDNPSEGNSTNPSEGNSTNPSGGDGTDDGTFTALQNKINRASENSVLYLQNDYFYDDGFNIEGIRIAKNITIHGNGHTIDALGKSRIFNVSSSNVTLRNIRFANGNASNGAAIFNGSAVNCIFINNVAQDGGAIYNGSALASSFINNSASRYGGAIYNGGAVNCSFINNSAGLMGAAIYNSPFAVNSTFDGNTVTSSNPAGGYVSVVSFNPITSYVPEPPSMTGSIGWGGAIMDFTRAPIAMDYNETFYLLSNFTLQENGFNDYGNVQLIGSDLVFKSLYPYSENYTMALYISGKVFTPSYVLGENDSYEAHFKLNGLPLGLHMVYAYVDFGYPEYYSFRISGGYMDRVMYDRTAEIIFPIYLDSTVQISSSDLSKYYGQSKKFIVNLTNNDDPISNANIAVSVAGKSYTIKTNSNGQASLDLNLTPGSYDIISTYNDSSSSSRVTVLSTIDCQDAAGTYLNAKLSATFMNTNGNPLSNTKVSFKVGSKTYTATTNANGQATANVDLGVGSYDFTAINPVNNEQKSAKLTISKAKSSISLSSTSDNDAVTLTAILSPSTASGNLVFRVNNKNYTEKISSGKAIKTITGLTNGNYTAQVFYSGDSNLNSSSASKDFTVKIRTQTKIAYSNMTTAPVSSKDGRIGDYFFVRLTDDKGNALAGLPIKIGFNGKMYDRNTTSNGGAKLQINLPREDIYTFAVCFLGDEDYMGSFAVAKITVDKKNPKPNSANKDSTGTVVSVEKTTDKEMTSIKYSNMNIKSVLNSDGRIGEYFQVKLVDSNGNALAGLPVKIGFNGKIYDRTTDANGGAKIQINLPRPSLYTFAVSYLGDSKYQGSFVVAKITVKAQSPKLTSSAKTFKASAKTKKLSATLVSERGKPISGQKLSFTVNGKTYTGKTNSKGVATVKISLNKKGTYSCSVKFAGMTGASAKTTKLAVKIT